MCKNIDDDKGRKWMLVIGVMFMLASLPIFFFGPEAYPEWCWGACDRGRIVHGAAGDRHHCWSGYFAGILFIIGMAYVRGSLLENSEGGEQL